METPAERINGSYNFEDALDHFADAVRAEKKAAINAAHCGTDWDYRKHDKARDECCDARDAMLDRFGEKS